ncbi:MAG TPA: AAA family ATPase, partial [Taishania sp.]|nr:AAA family ATPase [Taishania sp.]
SINHTLLTIEQLKRSGVVIAGIVVTGDRHEESEKIIQQITGLHVQLYIPYVEEVNHAFISQQADLNREKIQRWLLG